jgi:hypothetical protein
MSEKKPLGCTIWIVSWVVTIWLGAQVYKACTPENKDVGEITPDAVKSATAELAQRDAERAALQAKVQPILDELKQQTVPVGPVIPKLSRAKLGAYFANLGIPFELASAVKGRRRFIGQHADKMTIVEIMGGSGDTAESVNLLMGVDNSMPEVTIRNTGAIMVFMRETGWDGGHDWAISKLKTGGAKVHAGVLYEVTSVMPGIFMVSAKPNAGAAKREPAREAASMPVRPFAGNRVE